MTISITGTLLIFKKCDFFLKILSKAHGSYCVKFIKMKDAESGQYQWVDTSNSAVRAAYKNWWMTNSTATDALFAKCGVDNVSVSTEDDYVKALISLFKKRM